MTDNPAPSLPAVEALLAKLTELSDRYLAVSKRRPGGQQTRELSAREIYERCAYDIREAIREAAAIPSPQTWQPENEHAGGSLNGPSRLGASPNTDTGGECVLVPRSLLTSTLNLLGATSLGLHGTPWAQSEIQALIQALDRLIPVVVSPRGGPARKENENV